MKIKKKSCGSQKKVRKTPVKSRGVDPEEKYRRDRAIIYLLTYAGLRVDELSNLKLTDLDMELKRVRILGHEYMQERFKAGRFDTIVDYKGHRYKLISVSQGAFNFIYEDFPMLHYIYKNFEETLKRLHK